MNNFRLYSNFKMFKFVNDKRGVSLYLSIIVLSILLAIVLGLTNILGSQAVMIKGMGDSVVAFYAADTGIEEVLAKDKQCRCGGASCCGLECANTATCAEGILGRDPSDPLSGNVWPASYTATFDNGALDIISIGKYGSSQRAIEVTRQF